MLNCLEVLSISTSIYAWSYRWLVKINPNKTDIMIFSTRHLENNLLFDFNNISLSPVHMHKHLGAIFSNVE
jgi:hypothetical protein